MAVDRTRYNFNGKERLTKKSLVFEVVKKYLSDHKFNSSIRELENTFSKRSDFNIDMFVDEDAYQSFNDDRKRRYFSEPFILQDNQKVYLSNQWGGDVFQSLLNRLKNDGHQIQVYGNVGSDESPKRNLGINNIILYGVPGVGKTHNIAKLISLIEEGKSESEIFDDIRKNEPYERGSLEDIQDRLEFVTFHQSFGYEDFIEGFRPNEDGKITLQEGVFRRICKKAQENLDDSKKPRDFLSKKVKFEKLLELLINEIEESFERGDKYSLTTSVYISDIEEDAFRYKGDNWTIHSDGIRMRFDILEMLYISNVRSRQDIKKHQDIGGLAVQHATYFWKVLEKIYTLEEKSNLDIEKIATVEKQNYYLIIDEINRGNISKIFGELITLIEEDKRNTYAVTLPYSKEKFNVPSNLYIIGTMNSTDKSIALIDIALRRRFTFLKMQPNDGLVPEFSRDLFKSLNDKIKEKLGDEYQIGHSYFMNIADKDTLNFVLKYKIKPLLEEYFYGDKAGLEEVLNVMKERGE